MRTVTKKDVAKRTAKELKGENIYNREICRCYFYSITRESCLKPILKIRIEIRDFGVFEVKKTKPKPKARNPRSGEIIYVPARRKTHFKAGKLLKDVLKYLYQTKSHKRELEYCFAEKHIKI